MRRHDAVTGYAWKHHCRSDHAMSITSSHLRGLNAKTHLQRGDITNISPIQQSPGLYASIGKGERHQFSGHEKISVRHQLVTRIVDAYEKFDKETKAEREKRKLTTG